MNSGSVHSFGSTAKSLSGSPLGILALFIVLLYAFASLVTAFSGSFVPTERAPLIYFIVVFPFVVLGVFAWLVSQHPTKLYAPRDFQNEDNYVRTIALLAAAQAKSATSASTQSSVDVGAIIATVENTSRQFYVRSGESKALLWVDDHPENNVLERRAFESVGYQVILALSTQQAIEQLETKRFNSIISDMGRQEGPQEGYALLHKIRSSGNRTPFFIYAGSNSQEQREEAIRRGAQGSTNDPSDLFQLVTSANSPNNDTR